ncbi:MAG: flagellar basal body rod protein FlgB [Planctomycetaceae bacterium]
MVESLLSNPAMNLLERVAAFGERRHEVLAGNIANIETPNYRMRDLPVEQFHKALREAVQRHRAARTESASQSETAADVDDDFSSDLLQAAPAEPQNITFQDANNRSLELQVMEMTKNSMMQSFALELIRFQLNSLQSVISERP